MTSCLPKWTRPLPRDHCRPNTMELAGLELVEEQEEVNKSRCKLHFG